MTPEEINEAVARKLGWAYDEKFQDWGDPEDIKRPLPDYCHDIKAAWEVVERLHKSVGWTMKLDFLNGLKIRYECQIRRADDSTYGLGVADTAPMAICLAFLKLS